MSVRQHGIQGAYVGGEWVPIEECGDRFNIKDGSGNCGGDCSTCPRSRSKNSAAKADGSYDVVIIGSGCIGSAIARELSKTNASVLMLEAADDVTQGATKGNSGIVHAGYDDTPGSVRAKYCWKGNQMFPQLDKELHFGYQQNGSLVVAFTEEDEKHLLELKARGEKNGVERLRIVGKEELFKMEPALNTEARAALFAPDAGNLIPYEYAIALAENAVDNGVELRIRREVVSIEAHGKNGFTITAEHWEPKDYVDHSQGKGSPPLATIASKSSGMGPVLKVLSYAVFLMAVVLKQKLEDWKKSMGNMAVLIGLMVVLAVGQYARSEQRALNKAAGNRGGDVKDAYAIPPVGKGGRGVTVEEMKLGGSGSRSYAKNAVVVDTEVIKAKYVVNAAGGFSDKISAMIGDDSFKIKSRLGDYILLDRAQGKLANHTLFPCPGPLGKGVLVQTTLWGMLILGPTARDSHLPEVMAETPEEIQHYILSKCRQLVPTFDAGETITTFCGARSKSTRGDWIIEPSEKNPQFIQAAGIDSPGLAGSPAIALAVVDLLHKAGLKTKKNAKFNPNRAPIIVPKNGWKGIKAGPPGKFTDPKENVVCKCEKVTEAEVVEAMHRSLPIDSTQAIRKRTRAGMGHCQSREDNYNCECRVAEIIKREIDASAAKKAPGVEPVPNYLVGRRPWPATNTIPQRWLEDSQREKLQSLCKL